MTCGPLFYLAATPSAWGPRWAVTPTQIQSITDESRSSIRRKNQSGASGSSTSRQSEQLDDTKDDEVASLQCGSSPIQTAQSPLHPPDLPNPPVLLPRTPPLPVTCSTPTYRAKAVLWLLIMRLTVLFLMPVCIQ